ncbi:MAG: hypothetical protein UZ04_CHB001000018 [Chlorobi bacterium OLB4]|nr:MAG: hypothetical protein UZ04_CHB001000018 [Chlorobi bacterium OLB4]
MYKVLIIAYTELNSDPRPLKQIKILKEKFEVTSIGLKASNEEQKFYKLNKRSILKEALDLRYLFTKNYEKYFWTDERIEIVNQLKGCRFDCIIAHNELAIPLALKIDHNAKIILDAHEYFPEEESGTPLGRINKKFREYIMKTYSKIPSVTISVSENISKRYLEKWGIKSIVVTNLPKFHNIKPTLVNPQKIKLVHHGIVTPTRKIEKMINVLKELGDNYELTFFFTIFTTELFLFQKIKKNV